jgi:hypothetical protein
MCVYVYIIVYNIYIYMYTLSFILQINFIYSLNHNLQLDKLKFKHSIKIHVYF